MMGRREGEVEILLPLFHASRIEKVEAVVRRPPHASHCLGAWLKLPHASLMTTTRRSKPQILSRRGKSTRDPCIDAIRARESGSVSFHVPFDSRTSRPAQYLEALEARSGPFNIHAEGGKDLHG